MTDVVLLDAGPLGMVSHPRASVDIVEWLARLVASGMQVLIPEVADYELRRELLARADGEASSGWMSSGSVSVSCRLLPMRCCAGRFLGRRATAWESNGRRSIAGCRRHPGRPSGDADPR